MNSLTFTDSVEFRKEVLAGIKHLAQITAATLGPGGRPILLEQENGVLSTKDGVTVAQHYVGGTPVQRLVAQAAIEASARTVRSCGDGTTTSMLLAYSLTEVGQSYLEKNPSYSPQLLARDLRTVFNSEIKPLLSDLAKPIKELSPEEATQAIWHVASVSANGDKAIADAVTEAVEAVGHDGMVTVEEGAGGLETTVSHQSGFPVNSGLSDLGGGASVAFVNRKAYGDCALSGAYVVLYDGDVNDVESLIPLLEQVSKEKSPLVVIAHGFSDQVAKVMAQNFRQHVLSVVPMVTPRSGQANGRQQFLHDMSAYVGGVVFDPQGNSLRNATLATIGFCEEVKLGVNQSVFMTEPDVEEVSKRIDELKEQMKGASEFDCDKIRYRIGQLSGGVATIYSGGATALEARERRDRVVDAVSAVRSAIEMGVLPGGGTALVHVARNLKDEGVKEIFKEALMAPFVQIILNAGIKKTRLEALAMAEHVGSNSTDKFMVYDALNHKYMEFWSSGIFDAHKVTVNALSNALSIAQLLMTTGGAIVRSLSEGEIQAKAMQDSLMKVRDGDL